MRTVLARVGRAVVVAMVGGLVYCDSPKVNPPAPAPTDSARTAAAIKQFFPIACTANDAWWKWGDCHDTTKGFDAILKCTAAARDGAKAAAARLPPAAPTATADAPCAASVEAQSRRLATVTVTYLDDLTTWLTAHRSSLVGPLRNTSLQDLDDDKAKAGMPERYDAKYSGGPYGDALNFASVGQLDCTKSLYRCGPEDAPSHKLTYVECGVQAAAIRLGVDCGTSAPFQHADGTPYCPSMICDLKDPRAWLYDRETGQRVQ